ncbi:hypothetical protein LJR084_006832 [Variovorax sp. LjRoot84]|uniref:hypothetical protein n=1 Tax=Variovorax sp. LjRoot84 TaxID=3342340 RepID=UPI003ED04315
MDFPSSEEFLEEFGLEPTSVDPTMAHCRYVKKNDEDARSIDFSFSAVLESFQIAIKDGDEEIANFSSEGVKKIEIVRISGESGLRVLMGFNGAESEAFVSLEPKVHCRWWLIKN